MIGQAFGTGTYAEALVGQAGASYAHGFATIWYRQGAVASIVTAFVVYYLVNHHVAGEWHPVYRWQAAPFGWAMLAGTVALVLIGLTTQAEAPDSISAFFDKLRSSSDQADVVPRQTEPLAADHGQNSMLCDLPSWLKRERWQPFFHRYREDLVGFLLAWISVGALIGIALGIMQL